jgi:hypothetical protein
MNHPSGNSNQEQAIDDHHIYVCLYVCVWKEEIVTFQMVAGTMEIACRPENTQLTVQGNICISFADCQRGIVLCRQRQTELLKGILSNLIFDI